MPDKFTVSFTINGPQQGRPLLDAVADVALKWAQPRFGGEIPEGNGEWHANGDVVRVRRGEVSDACFWELILEHPDREDDGYRWRTEVRIATLGEHVDAYIDVRLLAVGLALLPDGKDVGRPGLMLDVISRFQCAFGGHPLTARALPVSGANAEVFTRDVILYPLRRLPVVVVTRSPNGFAVTPDTLQSWLVGLATVAIYDDDASWMLTEQLGQAMACFGGAIRIYWPGCSPADNHWRHRRWLPEHVRELGARLPRILFNDFASRFPRFADQYLFEEVTRQVRRAEQEETLRRLQGSGADEEFIQLLSDTVDEAERQRVLWEQRALDLEQANVQLRQELDQVRQNFRFIGLAAGGSDNEEDDGAEVNSVRGAVELAAKLGSIRFLTSAIETAAESTYHEPGAVYGAFEVLDELARELRKSQALGRTFEDWLGERGIEYSSHESRTAMGKWGSERRFWDGELLRTMEAHIKFGVDGNPRYCLRIYLDWDTAENEWVVGHIGRHLTTTQS